MSPVTWIRWRALRVWHFAAEANRTACGTTFHTSTNVESVFAEKPPTENVCFRCHQARRQSLPLFPPARRQAP